MAKLDTVMDAMFAQWLRETRPTSWKDLGLLNLRHLVRSYEAFIIAGNKARKGGVGWFPLTLDEYMQVWIDDGPWMDHPQKETV